MWPLLRWNRVFMWPGTVRRSIAYVTRMRTPNGIPHFFGFLFMNSDIKRETGRIERGGGRRRDFFYYQHQYNERTSVAHKIRFVCNLKPLTSHA